MALPATCTPSCLESTAVGGGACRCFIGRAAAIPAYPNPQSRTYVRTMSDFIAKYGLLSGIGGVIPTLAITGIVSRLRRRRDALAALPLPSRPLDVEVIPLWFQVFLNQQIPDVRVYVQV